MRVRVWVTVVLVMLFAGLVVPAHAQYFGQNKVQYGTYDWRSIRSDHFEVFFYEGSDSLAMRTLDLAEKTNAAFSRRLGHQLSKRIPIILYASHNDFSQTNVTSELIDGSTGGFTELLRDRVVVPFSGSYEDFRHVLVHELVHAFQFDILYNGTGVSLLSGQGFFQMPLWFAEGMAEYYSLGMEPNAEMWCRDGALTGYVPPLPWMSGYPVYKFGQSAIALLHERYGAERFRDLLKRARQMRNFDRAFQRTYGLTVEKYDEQWRTWLRKTYWPTVATQEHPEVYGKRLTDHRRDQSNINIAPAVSPQGDRIAYFSDRKQYTDIYIMSAFDGRVQRRLVRGERNVQFESWPLFRSSLTWSPDGKQLALGAKSAGRDRLYLVDAGSGKVTKTFELPCDALAYPSWSPTSDSIVVSGLNEGRSDLYLVDAGTSEVTRLTNDTWDEREANWSPDGRRVVFSSDRLAPVVLDPAPPAAGFGRYGIFELDLATRETRLLLDTAGEDQGPEWSPDGRRLSFISNRDGAPNIYLFDPADRSILQLTDVLGGITSMSWSRSGDRMVFSAFDRGGWDIFAVQEPLSTDAVVQRLRHKTPAALMTADQAANTAVADSGRSISRGALAGSWPDSATAPDSSLVPLRRRPEATRSPLPGIANEPPAWGDGIGMNMTGAGPFVPPPAPDTAAPRLPRTPLVERGGPFALTDSVLSQKPLGYRWRFGAEQANGGFAAASGYGFAGSTSILFADFLGDRNLYVATDVYPGALQETNALVMYSYLPRRWDWGAGAFHFKNYLQSRVTSLGEQLGSAQVFSERNYGALAQVAYPFDRFRRAELQFTQMFVERTFYQRDVFGYYYRGPKELRSVTSPSVSLVGDNSLSGYYGPVNGSRYNVTYGSSLALTQNSLEYQTLSVDFRRYWDLTYGYSFATRVMGAGSWGRDPQAFRIGGFATLRGWPDYDVVGSRFTLVNAELRFPFIQQLGLVGPVPLGSFNLKGAIFSDAALSWNEDDPLRGTVVGEGGRRLASPKLSFGTGIRSFMFIALFRLDVAWRTDLRETSSPRWHFSVGPEF